MHHVAVELTTPEAVAVEVRPVAGPSSPHAITVDASWCGDDAETPPVVPVHRGSSLPTRSSTSAAAVAAGDAESSMPPPVRRSHTYTHAMRDKQRAILTQEWKATPRARFERFLASRAVVQVSAGIFRELTTSARETYRCQICLMNQEFEEGVTLPCGHTFCADCLLMFATSKINEAIVDFTCPHVDDREEGAAAAAGDAEPRPQGSESCQQPIDEACLRDLLDAPPELLAKAARFRAMQDKHFRECPRCAHPNTDGPSSFFSGGNRLTCGACGHAYCFEHGDAHPGRSCRQYEYAQRVAERATAAAISQHYRKCPKPDCGMPIEKNGGCNHMTCYHCHTEFCWLCGERIPPGGVGWHYSPTNVFGCGGLHMEGGFREGTSTSARMRMIMRWRRLARARACT